MADKKQGKLDKILSKLDEHDNRFNRIESGLNEQAKKFLEHDRRFDEYDGKFSEMNNSMLSHFDKIYGRLGDLKQEYCSINAALKRIEQNLAPRLEKLEQKVGV